jgi:phosphate transport system substrate-binding protein
MFKHLLFISLTFFMLSCGNSNTGLSDTPTSGKAFISVDESYKLILDAELSMFHFLYKDAHISAELKPEGDVIQTLLNNDSCRLAIISRKLTNEEKDFFKKKKLYPIETKVALDAVAIIVHNDNIADSMSMDHLRAIFSGKIFSWNAIDSSAKQDSIHVIFDSKKSANARYLSEKFLSNSSQFPKNCFAVNSNPDVVNYVSEHPNSLGIISVNWISDRDDSLTNSFLKKVKVVALSSDINPYLFYQPYQAYIADGSYPLIREIWAINREGKSGLGTGFVAFVAGEKGQRIILKSGMVPATMPTRIVEIKTE